MLKLYSPETEAELSIIRSIFDAKDIHYYVLNDHFGTMRIGPKIDLLNAKTIYVSKTDFEFAKEILTDIINNTKMNDKPPKSQYSIPDKIRMVVEALIFGWFIPGKRWSHKESED